MTVITWSAVLAGTGFAPPGKQPRGDVYPLDYCVVTGKKLGSMGDPVIHDHQRREIRFCCKGCVKEFEAGPESHLKKIDAAIVKQQLPHYPLKKCVVTGEKLGGAMGKPVDYVHKNRLVRFCCKVCVKTFAKSPAKHLAKLDKAVIAKQGPSYPSDTCIVLGGALGSVDKPVNHVTGNRLVRFCCKGCVKTFEKEPAKYLAKLDEAQNAKSQEHESPGEAHGAHGQEEAHGESHSEHNERSGDGEHGAHSGHGGGGQGHGQGGHGGHGHHHGGCKQGHHGGNVGGSGHEH